LQQTESVLSQAPRPRKAGTSAPSYKQVTFLDKLALQLGYGPTQAGKRLVDQLYGTKNQTILWDKVHVAQAIDYALKRVRQAKRQGDKLPP